MGRAKRADEGGAFYHVLNRSNRRATIFHKDSDFEAFERIVCEALDRVQLNPQALFREHPRHQRLRQIRACRRGGDIQLAQKNIEKNM